MQLTGLGLSILPRANALLVEADRLVADARDERNSPIGTVALGVVPGWTQPLVSLLLSKLLADYPRIRLRVQEAYSGQVEDWVTNGRVDVAVFNRYRHGTVRGAEVVSRTDMMLVGPRNHPLMQRDRVAFRALADIPLCGPLPPNGLTTVMNEIASIAISAWFEAIASSPRRAIIHTNAMYAT